MGSFIIFVFVGFFEFGMVEGLGFIVIGKNVEIDRGFGMYCDVCNIVGSSVIDIVEVWGFFLDNYFEGDESVKVIG